MAREKSMKQDCVKCEFLSQRAKIRIPELLTYAYGNSGKIHRKFLTVVTFWGRGWELRKRRTGMRRDFEQYIFLYFLSHMNV